VLPVLMRKRERNNGCKSSPSVAGEGKAPVPPRAALIGLDCRKGSREAKRGGWFLRGVAEVGG